MRAGVEDSLQQQAGDNGPTGRGATKGNRFAVRVSVFWIEDTLFEETSEMQKDTVAAALGSARSST